MCDCGLSWDESSRVPNEKACESSKDSFLTTYRKAYTKKTASGHLKAVNESDYADILAGPFTEYVVLNSLKQTNHPYENVNHFYKRMMEENPKLKKHFDKEPNADIINADWKNRSRTLYQVDYCNLEDGFESKKTLARRRVTLPTGWGEIPATTQRASYRVPSCLATWDLHVHPIPPPPSALKPNSKEREILGVTTGESEYETRIGALGNTIIQEQLHGTHQDGLECLKYKQMLQAQRRH